MNNTNNYCLIMGGGIGNRVWPYSRLHLPKQFLDFFGLGRTLIQQTYDRYKKIIPNENIYVVTNSIYKDLVKEQLPELSEAQILIEPDRRNTAPCIAWSSFYLKKINPKANIVVTPADHLIIREDEFDEAIVQGLEFAAKYPYLLTLGIKPSRPETGYGYIQIDEKVEKNFYKVRTFIEKPELDFAKIFVESKEFFWNSGIFIWNVDVILNAFGHYMPDMYNRLGRDMNDFGACPNISIDYALMEKADNVYVQLCDFGWADVGTWGALHDISPKDENGNATINGDALLYDASDNIIAVPNDTLAVVQGLKGYLVATSGNVLLICKKDDEGSIRKFVTDAQLKKGDKYV